MIMVSSITGNIRLVPRFGPRPLVPTGMALACVGMVYLTGLSAHATYAADVLPSLLIMGLGFGLIFAPAISTATLGVQESDSGVASAMVNVSQQVGGSIGTALLSTIAVTASRASSPPISRRPEHPASPPKPPCTATRPRFGGRRSSSPSAR